MHVALKALSARNVVDHTEWKTTDLWLGVARLIPSPTLLERLLVKDGILEKQKYGMIDRNYTPFRSNVLRQRGIYLVIVERRLRRRDKNAGAESDLLNDLGFNLCVAPQSLVMRLVAYFGVKEVVKTEVL